MDRKTFETVSQLIDEKFDKKTAKRYHKYMEEYKPQPYKNGKSRDARPYPVQ